MPSIGATTTPPATFEECLKLDRQTGDAEGMIVRMKELGTVRYFQSRYFEAGQLFDRAAALLSRNQSAPWHAHLNALLLANQAVLYQRVGSTNALYRFIKACRRLPDAGHLNGWIARHLHIGAPPVCAPSHSESSRSMAWREGGTKLVSAITAPAAESR